MSGVGWESLNLSGTYDKDRKFLCSSKFLKVPFRQVELTAMKEKQEDIEEKVNNIISKDLKCAAEAKDNYHFH